MTPPPEGGAADAVAPVARKPPTYRPVSRAPTFVRRQRLATAGDVFAALPDLRTEGREHFVVFTLDCRHRIMFQRILAIGSLTGVEVHPREVFRQAIIDGAAALIVAHNHPSGDPTPSRQDLELTTRLREVGDLCGIPVLDHVIIAGDGFASLAERNWK